MGYITPEEVEEVDTERIADENEGIVLINATGESLREISTSAKETEIRPSGSSEETDKFSMAVVSMHVSFLSPF